MIAPVTSIVLLEGRVIQMLDFESISASVGLQGRGPGSQMEHPVETNKLADAPIVFAEDSRMISEMIKDELAAAGFNNVTGFSDGEQAWNYLSQLAEDTAKEDISQKVASLITDVEMPKMDGLNLTNRVRSHPVLKDVPVVIFSSLISRDNDKKGEQVGAHAQISKPRFDELTDTLRSLISQ